jgi:hypothetical protein
LWLTSGLHTKRHFTSYSTDADTSKLRIPASTHSTHSMLAHTLEALDSHPSQSSVGPSCRPSRQNPDEETIIEASRLEKPLHFKTTST